MKIIYTLLFSIVSILIFGQIPLNGLLGAWLFSGNANDVSGFGNHGTVNGATLTYGRCGNPNSAYSFNGTSDYINTLLSGPTGTNSRSLSFWAKTTNTTINSPRSCFDYGTVTGPGSRFQVVWNHCGSGVGLDVTNQAFIKGNNCLLNNQWHHIVVIYDATVSTVYSNVSLYIDAVLQPVIACNTGGTTQAINTGTVYPITFGAAGSSGVPNRFWSGVLDDFFLYNRPLTFGEINQLYVACPNTIFGNTLVCTGSSNVYTISPTTNASYTWTLPGGWSGTSTTNTISTTILNSGTISVAASGTCGSFGTSSLAVIVSNPVNSYTTTIGCSGPGSATVATSGGSGPYSYTWMPSSQTTSVATNLIPGTYTVSVFDAGLNCSSVLTTTINSPVPFTGTLSSTSSLPCFGVNTGTASIALSGGSASQSYSWISSSGVQTQSVATALGIGIHTITVVDVNSQCALTKTFQIVQPPTLSVNIAPSTTMACVGTPIVLAALNTGGTPPHVYNWVNGPPTSFYAPTQPLGGIYIYTVTSNDANNCLGSATISLTFVDYPTLTVNSPTICNGATAVLSVSGAQTYLWYPGAFTGTNVNVFPTATSPYTVIGNTFGCTTTVMTSVVVNQLPVPGIISNNNVCENLPINLSATGSGTYSWSGPNGFSSVSQNPVINLASLSNAGTYSLTVTDNNGCSASTSTLINVLTNPIPSAVGASVCIGEPATMTVSGGVSYLWLGPGSYVSTNSHPIIPVVDNNTMGSYTVFVTGTNSCVVNVVVDVLGYPYPLPSPTIIANPRACLNSTVSLEGLGGTSYLWTGPGNLSSTNSTLIFTPENATMSGIYTLTVKNSSNCAASATVLVSVYPLPNAVLVSSRNNMCVPFCSDFNLIASPSNIAPIKGFYFVNAGGFFSDSILTTCFQVGENKLLKVNYVDTNNCVNTSTLLINAYPKPAADFEFFPPEPKANSDIVMFTDLSITTPQSDWTWFFENDDVPSKEINPVHIFDFSNVFPVVLLVKNSFGCVDTMIKAITVDEEISLFVPNVFTPNGDGLNDVFQPLGVGIAKYNLEIFDRWGHKVFNTVDFNKYWDGTSKGGLIKFDTYVWRIHVTGNTGKEKKYEGTVNILR